MKSLDELQSDKFAVRQKAMQVIAAMGQAAKPELRRLVKEKGHDLETVRRVELLLGKLEYDMAPEEVRLTRRAIVVLERVGSAEAQEILAGIVYGVPDELLIAEAWAALARLKQEAK